MTDTTTIRFVTTDQRLCDVTVPGDVQSGEQLGAWLQAAIGGVVVTDGGQAVQGRYIVRAYVYADTFDSAPYTQTPVRYHDGYQ